MYELQSSKIYSPNCFGHLLACLSLFCFVVILQVIYHWDIWCTVSIHYQRVWSPLCGILVLWATKWNSNIPHRSSIALWVIISTLIVCAFDKWNPTQPSMRPHCHNSIYQIYYVVYLVFDKRNFLLFLFFY